MTRILEILEIKVDLNEFDAIRRLVEILPTEEDVL